MQKLLTKQTCSPESGGEGTFANAGPGREFTTGTR